MELTDATVLVVDDEPMLLNICIYLPLSRGRQIRVPQDFAGFELRLQYGG
jgi:hypothetical protein